eukprot:TRINITY_DN1241_c0_g1_i1.p1 TRINITY_DN1241_c0_g1~~TRINITY_DN1241_c0_g1_i1.p1  ORF type:complete len:746 (+),score=207.97 TRINITY_DN1241_c0_g1_i1:231-2240(+)
MEKIKALAESKAEDGSKLVYKFGKVGESPVHWALIRYYSTQDRVYKEIAEYLMKTYPELVNSRYTQEPYLGETCAHLCAAHNDLETLKFLDENKFDFLENPQATGEFFKGRGKGFKGQAYFGQNILAFAVCTNSFEIVKWLIEIKRLHPMINQPDANGNTTMHLCVIHSMVEVYEYLLTVGGDPDRKNKLGHTAFSLAAKLGRKEIFMMMLDKRRSLMWRWGPVEAWLYELDGLDTPLPPADLALVEVWNRARRQLFNRATHLDLSRQLRAHHQPEESVELSQVLKTEGPQQIVIGDDAMPNLSAWDLLFESTKIFKSTIKQSLDVGDKNALNLIVRNEHYDMLDLPIVVTLLEEKWRLFGFRMFMKWFAFDFLLAALLTVAVATHTDTFRSEDFPNSYASLISQLLLVFMCLGYIFHEMWSFFRRGTFLISTARDAIFRKVFCLFIIASPVLRGVGHLNVERGVLSIAAISGWFVLLRYGAGFRKTGPFVIMIWKMVVTDVARFVLIYVVVLLGFAEAFFLLYQDSNHTGYGTIGSAVVSLFLLAVGTGNIDEPDLADARLPVLAVFLFISYAVIVLVLLLNMLIAMMGYTFSRVYSNADKEWMLQWASIILLLEQRLSVEERKKYMIGVQVPQRDTRVLMMTESAISSYRSARGFQTIMNHIEEQQS